MGLSLLFGRVRGLACVRLGLLGELTCVVACFLGVEIRRGCFRAGFCRCLGVWLASKA